MAVCEGCLSLAVPHAALEERVACFTLAVPAGPRHHPPAHLLGTFPMGLATLPFAGEPGPVQRWGKAAFLQAGALPKGTGTSVLGSRWAALRHPSRQSTISPFPLLSMAESRSPAVLVNGRSRKERGLAAAPVCAELARAAACLLPGTQAGLARYRCLPTARPAGRRACRQPCSQLALRSWAGASGSESCLPKTQELGWGAGI